jgi:hypothetical protein
MTVEMKDAALGFSSICIGVCALLVAAGESTCPIVHRFRSTNVPDKIVTSCPYDEALLVGWAATLQ